MVKAGDACEEEADQIDETVMFRSLGPSAGLYYLDIRNIEALS